MEELIMNFTAKQKEVITNYLKVSNEHTKAEAKLNDDEFLPMTKVYEEINKLKEHFKSEEIDYIIINRDELANALL